MPGERILIVEDNAKNLKLIRDVLQYHGYTILEATTGEEGVALALAQRPALVLMDVQLPGMDGRTAMQMLKADPHTRHIPVVALTAFAMKGDRERLLADGFDGYMSKPIAIKEVAQSVAQYLHVPSAADGFYAAAVDATAAALKGSTMDESQAKILVVDDEIKNVKLLEALLLPRGYEVIKASNGEEALLQVFRGHPDLILLDVMMPVMNGFEACKILKDNADTRLIPIVIMTALGNVEDRIKGIEAGADDFLTKPVHRDELLARIRTSLRLKQTIERKMETLYTVQEHLAKFVPQAVKRLIEANPEAPALEKQEQDVSVLFVDLSGYSRLSQRLPLQDVNRLVEAYFSSVLDCIHTHAGDINETAGDGIMAIFMDTYPHRHAIRAVQTAIEAMQRTVELNTTWQDRAAPLAVHIGINSGPALVGSTKFEGVRSRRWTYTASGPMTNLAARLAARSTPGTVLVGPETAWRVAGTFPTRELGRQQFKNFQEEVLVYQILTSA